MSKEIALTQGKVAIVDDADHEWLIHWRWFARTPKGGNTSYAYRPIYIRGQTPTTLLMHRAILDAPSEMQVDHIDGDGLNNTRDNLRLATHAQNQHNAARRRDNKSGFKGVRRLEDSRWQARICVNGKQMHVGLFQTAEEAARAYDQAARDLRGEFAKLNF